MGLTKASTGRGAVDAADNMPCGTARVIALAGNPNVGKSTVFNQLTGMHQHTGNWPGKTVVSARGSFEYGGEEFLLVDLPGCYSLLARSAEEEVARDFICFGGAEATAVVCDATCLERNMALVLQIMEITPRVVLCVNLMDEARRKGVSPDVKQISGRLGVPAVCMTARSHRQAEKLIPALIKAADILPGTAPPVRYPDYIENELEKLSPLAEAYFGGEVPGRWYALRLLENSPGALESIRVHTGLCPDGSEEIRAELLWWKKTLSSLGLEEENVRDDMAAAVIKAAGEVCSGAVTEKNGDHTLRDRRIDAVVTSRLWGFPMMFAMLMGIFWLTIVGANWPARLLSSAFGTAEAWLFEAAAAIGVPDIICRALIQGVFRVLCSVIAVMLPPMAIFFPLFTLLEDLGYLPRVAYNLDRLFKSCSACGKQALTMCMGFGCNAAGVTGCRIIDSPRERLIAIITNSFVPCNGRFPMLISIISIFFLGGGTVRGASVLSALALSAVIVLCVGMTLAVSRLLSATVLRGEPSSFTLELPPYRTPQLGRIIVRSVLDRTLFVLGRAAAVAAPAGLLIWMMANVTVSGRTLLAICSGALDPLGRLLGMDGVILMAFILGLPANEIVLPIIIMAYASNGTLADTGSLEAIGALLAENGWTWVTAVSVLLFSLMHWPCSTTCLTIKKESGSWKWTAAAVIAPTVCGMLICLLFTATARLLFLR